jgi:hypothetical protein
MLPVAYLSVRMVFRHLLLILLATASFFTGNTQERKNDAAQVSRFFYKAAACYFNKDCSTLYQLFADSLYVINPMGNEQLIHRSALDSCKKICEEVDSKLLNKMPDIETYKKNYTLEVLPYHQFIKGLAAQKNRKTISSSRRNIDVLEMLQYAHSPCRNGDWLLMGNIPRRNEVPGFDNGYFIVIVRKENNNWKIFATTQ